MSESLKLLIILLIDENKTNTVRRIINTNKLKQLFWSLKLNFKFIHKNFFIILGAISDYLPVSNYDLFLSYQLTISAPNHLDPPVTVLKKGPKWGPK